MIGEVLGDDKHQDDARLDVLDANSPRLLEWECLLALALSTQQPISDSE
jgi:hypothetical protein